jgi:hypothetical protein
MTINRRALGSSRRLLIAGAFVVLAGCLLPWWTVGGTGDLPTRSGNAFDATGILVFLAAIATLAIVTLPVAAGRAVAIDRWLAYAIVTVVGWLALAARIVDLALSGAFTFREPAEAFTRNPGLWVAAVGLIVMSRAVDQLFREPPIR